MAGDFKVGDHVEWNSEAGRVRGTIKKKHVSEVTFKGYRVHASKEEPQYLIKSDKTDRCIRVRLSKRLLRARSDRHLEYDCDSGPDENARTRLHPRYKWRNQIPASWLKY
jgi:Hypervirulence associated proteins TUDOR domain